jgi:hypothetical protein
VIGEAVAEQMRPKVTPPTSAAPKRAAASATPMRSFSQDVAARRAEQDGMFDPLPDNVLAGAGLKFTERAWNKIEGDVNRFIDLAVNRPSTVTCNLWSNGMCTPWPAPPVVVYPNGDSRAMWEAKQFAAGFGNALVDSGLAVLDGYRMIAGMALDRKVEAWSKVGKASQAGQISFSISGIASGLGSSLVNMSPAGILVNMGAGRAREAGEGAAGLLQLAAGTPRAMAALNRVPVLGAEVPLAWSRSAALASAQRGAVDLGGVGGVANSGLSVKPYSGDVFAPEFVGPVKFETLFRGDATQRTDFLSSMAAEKGLPQTQRYLNSLANDTWALKAKNHSFYNDGSPFVSVSNDRRVAEYFSKGEEQIQFGWVTEFRVPSGNQANSFKYNWRSEFNEPNGVNRGLGLSEGEFLAPGYIDPRYIHLQYPVKP